MSLMNRLGNAKNPYQGEFKKVLCICSAGLLRSPTAALVLSQEPFGYNTRAAGIEPDFALVIVDEVLIEWADEFVCMTKEQEEKLRKIVPKKDDGTSTKPIFCLNIPDNFGYRDPKLMKMIKDEYTKLTVKPAKPTRRSKPSER